MIELSKNITKTAGKTNYKYNLIQEGDRVILGLSGGKDSLALAHTLKHIQRHAPFDFEFIAVTIDYGMGENFDYLHSHCLSHGIAHEIYKTEIYSIAKEKIRENSSFCSFFSRMRRGALYSAVEHFKGNKLALAHHLDDAVESFFMNMFYNGSLRSMPPIYKASNGIDVIRPLIQVRERQLIDFALKNNLQVIGDEACPSLRFDVKSPFNRAKTKEFVKNLELQNPNLFIMLKSSFEHIHTSTFFDNNLLSR